MLSPLWWRPGYPLNFTVHLIGTEKQWKYLSRTMIGLVSHAYYFCHSVIWLFCLLIIKQMGHKKCIMSLILNSDGTTTQHKIYRNLIKGLRHFFLTIIFQHISSQCWKAGNLIRTPTKLCKRVQTREKKNGSRWIKMNAESLTVVPIHKVNHVLSYFVGYYRHNDTKH